MPRIVFLGTPAVVVQVLESLVQGADGRWEVVGVVTQPPARSSRRGGASRSPVHEAAERLGLRVLAPETARDPLFLQELRDLAPDLCVTAAYGNFLPDAFLSIPPKGTVNIHPSLLPLFRGAAPVQRAVEAGVPETGVSLCMTVKAMDAGPLVHQESVILGDDESAPELLDRLFALGTLRLVELMPRLLSGEAPLREQEHARATHARKVDPAEGLLDFSLSARILHNKVRAFFGWPGTRAWLKVGDETLDVKIVRTRLGRGVRGEARAPSVAFVEGCLRVVCGDGSELDILELQCPGKKALPVRDFWNGLKDRRVALAEPATISGSPTTTGAGGAG